MKRSKYSRSTRSASVPAAPPPRARHARGRAGVASPRRRQAARAARRPARAPAAAESSAYSCARAASTSSTSPPSRMLAVEIGAQDVRDRRRSRPRPTSTRSAGTRVQFETDGCEMPIWRASSLTPPAARIASSRPHCPASAHRFFIYCNFKVATYRAAVSTGVNSSEAMTRTYHLGKRAPMRRVAAVRLIAARLAADHFALQHDLLPTLHRVNAGALRRSRTLPASRAGRCVIIGSRRSELRLFRSSCGLAEPASQPVPLSQLVLRPTLPGWRGLPVSGARLRPTIRVT